MAGAARADFLIGRVGCHAAGIADRSHVYPVAQFPEFALGAPEAAEAEHRLLEAFRIWAFEPVMIDEMRVQRC